MDMSPRVDALEVVKEYGPKTVKKALNGFNLIGKQTISGPRLNLMVGNIQITATVIATNSSF